MTRIKKQRRHANLIVLDKTPKKKERLSDPDSYESRKLRALNKRKKHKSVYQKVQEQQTRHERDTEAGRRGGRPLGPLADKIRKLNADKKAAGQAAEADIDEKADEIADELADESTDPAADEDAAGQQ